MNNGVKAPDGSGYRFTIRLADTTAADGLRSIADDNGWSLGEAFQHVVEFWQEENGIDYSGQNTAEVRIHDEIEAWLRMSTPILLLVCQHLTESIRHPRTAA